MTYRGAGQQASAHIWPILCRRAGLPAAPFVRVGSKMANYVFFISRVSGSAASEQRYTLPESCRGVGANVVSAITAGAQCAGCDAAHPL